MNLSGFKKAQNGEYYGSNSWHGSSTGMNTWVNPSKNVAYCFRCNSGINVAKAIALNEGIISNCSDSLTKEDFFKVLEIAQTKHGLKKAIEETTKSFLIESRQKYESIGCGLTKGIYYFGTKLFRDNKPYSAIVTSDKKVYIKKDTFDEIRNSFGLNYKNDFYEEGIDNIMSKEAITKWCYENPNDITLKSLYEQIIEVLKKYIYFADNRNYSLLACYRIAGFFMPLWRARARLFIYAEMGSAKSRLTQIMHNTGFNSIALGDWSLPYIQRLIESTRGETHIDDFETLEEEKKNASVRLIKTGYMRGFKAGKISEGKEKKPETFDLFNTTSLNNTEGLDFISFDRCISVRIPKISNKDYDKEPNFSEPIWKQLRDKLYIAGLKYASEVKENYEKITSDKIRGRLFLIIKPELTIAKMIDKQVYEEIEDLWLEEIEQRDIIDYETNWEFLALKEVCQLKNEDYFNLKETITKPIFISLYSDKELKPEQEAKKKRGIEIAIGKVFTRSPIFKKRQVKGKTEYKVTKEDLVKLLEAKKFLQPIKEQLGERAILPILPIPPYSTNSTNSTYSTKEHNNFDNKANKEVEKVECVEWGYAQKEQCNSLYCAICGSTDNLFTDSFDWYCSKHIQAPEGESYGQDR